MVYSIFSIGSMYGIFTHIYHQKINHAGPCISKDTISHGSYGIVFLHLVDFYGKCRSTRPRAQKPAHK